MAGPERETSEAALTCFDRVGTVWTEEATWALHLCELVERHSEELRTVSSTGLKGSVTLTFLPGRCGTDGTVPKLNPKTSLHCYLAIDSASERA